MILFAPGMNKIYPRLFDGLSKLLRFSSCKGTVSPGKVPAMKGFAWLVTIAAAISLFATPAYPQTTPSADATITGEGPDDDFGWKVAPAWDVNGDGIADVIVGAPSNDAVAQFAGRAYLFSGPLEGEINTGNAEAIITAEAFGDNLGFSVASAGDVNGDGVDDILIGARSNDDAGIQAGRVYLFYGPVSGNLAATSADAIITGAAFDELGRSVAPLGDLNGDGFDDVVLGTDIAGPGFAGQVFVFNGPLSGLRSVASADAVITGSFSNESFGAEVAGEDLNGDGTNDLIAGAPRFPLDGNDTGRSYVFYGPISGSIIATDADAILFGENINDSFGTSVASAGDVDGDGQADLIVGADQIFNQGTGKAYLFKGPIAGEIQASNATAIFTGEAAQDLFGHSVASAGDFNGDGFADVFVGAPNNGPAVSRGGRAYVFFGPLSGTLAAAEADFIVTGQAGDELGMSVASGHVNGDTVSDLIVGAPGFTDGLPGYAAMFFGTEAKFRLTITPRDGPIVIPPEGGSFQYDLVVVNQTNDDRTLDVWVTLSGNGLVRKLTRFRQTFPPGEFHRTLTQRVQGSLEAGPYNVIGNAGRFPTPRTTSNFGIVKE
jgi:hypothetical protein